MRINTQFNRPYQNRFINKKIDVAACRLGYKWFIQKVAAND